MKKECKKRNFIWLLLLTSWLFIVTATNVLAEDVTNIATFKESLEEFSKKKFVLTNPKITEGVSGDLYAFSNLSSGEASSAELLSFSWEFNTVFYRTSIPVYICEFQEDKHLREDSFSISFSTKNLEGTSPEAERILAELITLKGTAPQSFLRRMLSGGNVDKITIYLSSETRKNLGI